MAKIDLFALMKSRAGRVVISIAWGLALALVFKKTCDNGRCSIVVGPPVGAVAGRTYEFAGHGCYTFAPKLVPCAAAKRTGVEESPSNKGPAFLYT
jgi:hypothetical protein